MKAFRSAAAIGFAALLFSAGVAARPVEKHQLSTADHASIDALTDRLFARLKAGEIEAAVQGFLGTSGLMEGKKAELAQLASQIRTTLDIYGPVSNCLLARSQGRVGLVEEQQFICQHDQLATRWKLTMVKTTRGWIAGNLYFDDKLTSED